MTKPNTWIGCWSQPVEMLDGWKLEGVNCVIGSETGNPRKLTQAQYHAECGKRGLYYISTPESPADLERMVIDPMCLAIAFPDEPDLNEPLPNASDHGVANAAYLAAWMTKNKWIADQTAKRKKLFVNFCGDKIMGQTQFGYKGALQQPFINLMSPGDIICSDFYPHNRDTTRYTDAQIGEIIKWTKQFWPGFQYWIFIETSDQLLDKKPDAAPGRGPTPQEIQAQFNAARAAEPNVQIAWFSHKFDNNWDATKLPNSWDGRTPEQRAKCKEIAMTLNPPPPNPEIEALKAQVAALAAQAQALDARLAKQAQLLEDTRKQTIVGLDLRRGL